MTAGWKTSIPKWGARGNSNCTLTGMEDTIADLHYIVGYANIIRDDLKNGKTPMQGFVNRMAELADKVQRTLDPNYEEWCNVQARRGNGA